MNTDSSPSVSIRVHPWLTLMMIVIPSAHRFSPRRGASAFPRGAWEREIKPASPRWSVGARGIPIVSYAVDSSIYEIVILEAQEFVVFCSDLRREEGLHISQVPRAAHGGEAGEEGMAVGATQ